MKIRIGTRGSKLALTQTEMVMEALLGVMPSLELEKVIISTKGDRITDVSLEKIGDKGLFVKEIEERLIIGEIDLAVHSMKDMPFEGPPGLKLLPVLKRADARDVLVTRHKIDSWKALPDQPVIATGSKRRSGQLRSLMPGVVIRPIRGNVETRIRKMLENGYDGTILAAAGLDRLGIKDCEDYKLIPFDVEEMIPAPAQGIIGAQFRKDHEGVAQLIEKLSDAATSLQAEAERRFLKEVQGSCHLPMAAYLVVDPTQAFVLFGDESCERIIRKQETCNLAAAEETMAALAKTLYREVNR